MDEAILTQLESEPLATLVRPAPLSLEAVAQLLRTRLASDPAPLFLETVYTSCGGNPLLLNELVHAVLVERIEPSADVPPRGRASVVATLHEAAQRASGEGAADVARSYLDRALAEPPDEHQRADVLFELGSAELRSGQPGAIGHLQEALGLVQGQPRSVEIALALANAHFAWDVYLFEAADGLQRTIESLDTRDAALAQRLEAELIMWARFDARLYSMARERLARIADRASEESLGGRMLLMLIASELARTGESPDRARELVGRALVGGALLGDETREAYMVAVAVLVSLDELDDADHGVRRRGRHRAGRDPGRGVRRRRQTHCLGHEPRGHGRQLRSQAASGSKLDHRQAGRVAKASPAEAGCLQRSWPPQSRSACPGPR
jgi:hypothetical protein